MPARVSDWSFSMGDVSGVLQIAVVVFLFFATKTLPTLWHGKSFNAEMAMFSQLLPCLP